MVERWKYQRTKGMAHAEHLAGIGYNKFQKRYYSHELVCGCCLRIKDRHEMVRTDTKRQELSTGCKIYNLAVPFLLRASRDLDVYAPDFTIGQLRMVLLHAKPEFEAWFSHRHFCNVCAGNIKADRKNPGCWNEIGPVVSHVPELDRLTFAERRLIGLCSVAAELHIRRSNEQHGLTGCVVMAPRDEPVHLYLYYCAHVYFFLQYL